MAANPTTGMQDNPSLAQQSLAVILPPARKRYDAFGWIAGTLFLATVTYFWTKMLDDIFVGFKD